MLEQSTGRGGGHVRHILGEGLLGCFDENIDVVRRERDVRIELAQLLEERGDFAAAGVARSDPERAQEREF